MARIFLSYDVRNSKLAARISDVLVEADHTVFTQNDLLVGDIWRDVLQNRLISSDIVVLLVENIERESVWLAFEAGVATAQQRQAGRPVILPVLVDNTMSPPYLQHIQALTIQSTFDRGDVANLLDVVSGVSRRLSERDLPFVARAADELLRSLPSTQVARVTLRSKQGLPSWTLTHYLDALSINHMKLFLTQRICELLARGAHDEDFEIGSTSADLVPSEDDPSVSIEPRRLTHGPYNVLGRKDEDARRFWTLLTRLRRPVVRFRYHGIWNELFLPSGPEAARVGRFLENSPPIIDIQGAGGALIDLIYGPEREERARVGWENEQIGRATENIERIARASQVIESPETPSGVKAYARQQLQHLQAKQAALNKRLGVSIENVDTVA